MFLSTERTEIRPFLQQDLDNLMRLCANDEAMKYIPPHFHAESKDQVAERLDNYINHQDQYGISFGAVFGKKGDFIGRAGFYFVPEVNMYEVGYSLLPEYWGHGIATEILNGLLNYAFKRLNLDCICARTIEGNSHSEHILQKAGFTYLGERAFVVKDSIFFWHYYEHQNEENLNLADAFDNSSDDWDFLL